MCAVLGVLLPIAFAVGIAARKPVPSVAALPAGLLETAAQSTVVWKRSDLFAKHSIEVRLLNSGGKRFAIAFSAARDFVKPDLLVYWSAAEPTATDYLPEHVTLLGAFGASALALPAETTNTGGSLILFSLADQEVVSVSAPIRFNAATPQRLNEP